MAVPILRLNIDDNPRIIVKQDSIPVTVTGYTSYDFIGSGGTTVTEVQTGNHIDVTIFSETPTGVSITIFSNYNWICILFDNNSWIIINI